ncbi:hypothetical protein A3B02_00790 [Candidatus Roizmanbacteria bacterium RIFCSPLOWO2_01_FULL_42_14]|uniref:Uncharacterized protein n=3 Tax=Candidatus Roizmaniibacteriota TaxID=1752723 RepID=A0A1F7K1P9_9BACT|nr:MAG: hypothetical protein A3F32_02735 [Candidatus Roizmanbacteria bacterium RIFCSPHIGHO2_12_FULL_42_10]OGK51665.1 MAG: hypothetical protein A3B02_00790 [Candidatus Roizmanbacteria bacterium RIFCSPLOWO2_01_FULL_42_14]OGK61745.1 MAG: hypothetical protein A3I56_04715 [Candidatus Roizmanbacteria bacterium RIFCSPLOWO2_02_FULL_43_10]
MWDLKSKKISPYTLRLIKQHIAYAIACLLFIGLIITVIPYQMTSYMKSRSDLTQTNKEIGELSARANAIKSYPTQDLEDLVLSMNALYPSDEDKFSIFNALDNLQVITSIEIDSYASPFAGKTFREISIPVRAHANIETLRKFLGHHVFKSGRFMTISQVSFNQDKGLLSFTAHFHTRRIDVNTKKPVAISANLIKQAEDIQREIEASGFVRKDAPDESKAPLDYSTKQNPFQ